MESEAHHAACSAACAAFHTNYSRLVLPGGPYDNFFERLRAGEPEIVEVALCFLEVRPYFFRSGYLWKEILRKCRHARMSQAQAERFNALFSKYIVWKQRRIEQAKRGHAIKLELWPIVRRFYGLFPIRMKDDRFDGVATVADIYNLLCRELKIEPLSAPESSAGKVHSPHDATPQRDMSAWSSNYESWRRAPWTAEDVWATLVANIREAYELDRNTQIAPVTRLRDPDTNDDRG